MAREFTREEFYDLVWSRPMTHLARDFAVSDAALHKVCRKHGIPKPSVGYWNKKEAGKKVVQTPLPLPAAGQRSLIRIVSGDLIRASPSIAAVRDNARVLASKDVGDTKSHPIVDRTIARLRKGKKGDLGLITVEGGGLVKCEVGEGSIDRLGSILNRIAQAAAQLGFRLVGGDKTASFQNDQETVAFSITEGHKREKHVVTNAEQGKLNTWESRRDRAAQSTAWDVFHDLYDKKPAIPEWDYSLTGRLSFEFEHAYFRGGSSLRRSYRDAKVQRLDTMAGDIAVGLAVLAAAKTENRLRLEEEQRRAEEARRERELAARVKHVEERRASALVEILQELQEIDRLQGLLVTLEDNEGVAPSPRVGTFLDWARGHLAARREAMASGGLELRFTDTRLFGTDDDFDLKKLC